MTKNTNDLIVKRNNACIRCLRFSHSLNFNDNSSVVGGLVKDIIRPYILIHIPIQIRNSYLLSTLQSHREPDSSSFIQNSNPNTKNIPIEPKEQLSNAEILNCDCPSKVMSESQSTSLFSTTLVHVLDVRGNYQSVRASFISENCLRPLGLSRKSFNNPLLGINPSSSTTSTIEPVSQYNPIYKLEIFILPKFYSEMPSIHINKKGWDHISNLKLGDDKIIISAFLGAHTYSQIMKSGIIHGQPGQPIALGGQSLGILKLLLYA